MNWSEIYDAIGPAGVVLAAVACAGVYLAIKSYAFLFFVWRDFRRTFPELENEERSGECMSYEGDNPLICIVRDIVQTHSGHSEDIGRKSPISSIAISSSSPARYAICG